MPQGRGALSGTIVRLGRNLYWLKLESTYWCSHLITHPKSLGFEQSLVIGCGFRLMEVGSISVTAVMRGERMFAIAHEERCDRFSEYLAA